MNLTQNDLDTLKVDADTAALRGPNMVLPVDTVRGLLSLVADLQVAEDLDDLDVECCCYECAEKIEYLMDEVRCLEQDCTNYEGDIRDLERELATAGRPEDP